jgi:phage terminase large subunit
VIIVGTSVLCFFVLQSFATWQVLGSDRYDAAVGSPPYGITFSEWALSNPASWAYLAPMVIENGGWSLFITTARGRNHAKSMLDMAQTPDDWFSEVLPVNVTGAMSEEAVEEQRVEHARTGFRPSRNEGQSVGPSRSTHQP